MQCWASVLFRHTADEELRDIAKMPRAMPLRPHCSLDGNFGFLPLLWREFRSRDPGQDFPRQLKSVEVETQLFGLDSGINTNAGKLL